MPALSSGEPSFDVLARGATTSLMFAGQRPPDVDDTPEPTYFRDLHLDQVVRHLVGKADPFDLAGLLHAVPASLDDVRRRREVFADLAQPQLREIAASFSETMSEAIDALRTSRRMRDPNVAKRFELRAVDQGCTAAQRLAEDLVEARPTSAGLRDARRAAQELSDDPAWAERARSAGALQARLREVCFHVHLLGPRVAVGECGDESALERRVFETFARFRPPEIEPTTGDTSGRIHPIGWDPVRDRVVEQVFRLHPDLAADVDAFLGSGLEHLDPTMVLLLRELQLFLRYQEMTEALDGIGLDSCLPTDTPSADLSVTSTYDLALGVAAINGKTAGDVVTNDVRLAPQETTLVITGPNNGGKTTMARTIGQLHHLAALGCPVAGTDADVPVVDRIFTHFERPEEVGTRASKLETDLRALALIVDSVTRRSLVILNETFSSTTAQEALPLGRRLMGILEDAGCRTVYVTFLDELSRRGEHTASMTSMVAADDPARRTYEVVRRRADGRAYASSLAARYGLDREQVAKTVLSDRLR